MRSGHENRGEMLVYYDDQIPPAGQGPRAHPYAGGLHPDIRYYDFRAHPELIPTVLEDFLPVSHFPAIQRFYDLLAWINGPDSVFESNDCGLRPIRTRQSPTTSRQLECSGRLMIFLRTLSYNTSEDHVAWSLGRFKQLVSEADPTFRDGCLALTLMPCAFLALSDVEEEQFGEQLQITWWAFGDSDGETMAALGRCYAVIHYCLRQLSEEISTAERAKSVL